MHSECIGREGGALSLRVRRTAHKRRKSTGHVVAHARRTARELSTYQTPRSTHRHTATDTQTHRHRHRHRDTDTDTQTLFTHTLSLSSATDTKDAAPRSTPTPRNQTQASTISAQSVGGTRACVFDFGSFTARAGEFEGHARVGAERDPLARRILPEPLALPEQRQLRVGWRSLWRVCQRAVEDADWLCLVLREV
eukprot:1090113-Rhodomonas_salina.3